MTEPTWAADGSDAAVAEYLAKLIGGRTATALALPGGETPAGIYAGLASRNLEWDTVVIWPTDDRLVPMRHPASNIGAMRRVFGNTGARLQPLGEGAVPPRFDVVWLGMGTDGHVASLFAGNKPDPEVPARVIRVTPAPLPPEAPFDRLTLTIAALVATTDIIIVIRGAAKKAVLEAAAAGKNDLPVARLLRAAECPVTIYWSA